MREMLVSKLFPKKLPVIHPVVTASSSITISRQQLKILKHLAKASKR